MKSSNGQSPLTRAGAADAFYGAVVGEAGVPLGALEGSGTGAAGQGGVGLRQGVGLSHGARGGGRRLHDGHALGYGGAHAVHAGDVHHLAHVAAAALHVLGEGEGERGLVDVIILCFSCCCYHRCCCF